MIAVASRATDYDVRNLGFEGWASDINNRGQVIGIDYGPGRVHAGRWGAGQLTELGTLGGGGTVPQRINDRGEIVGCSETASGETHAFLWRGGTMQDLGTLGDSFSYACDINEDGQIVGFAGIPGRPGDRSVGHAAMWDRNGAIMEP